MPRPFTACFIILVFFSLSCKSFRYGYTHDKAIGQYNLVTGDEKSFGDKRLMLNKAYHRHTGLSVFMECKGDPDFIYEYLAPKKADGIRLYYTGIDSVYIFEGRRKNNAKTYFVQSRSINNVEQSVYESLKRMQRSEAVLK